MESTQTELVRFWEQFSDKSATPLKPIDFTLVNQIAKLFSPADFYYYIINFIDLKMEFVSDNYEDMTGLDPKSFSINQWLEAVHPEEMGFIQKCEKAIEKFFFNHLTISDALQYKVSYSYKMRGKNGNYFQSLHQTTALSLTENNSIGHVLGIETNIEHLFNRPKKSISFIDLKTQNHYLNIDVDDPDFKDNIKFPHGYTQQEIKIIELISYGHSSEEIAEILSLSNHTVKTHRANILSKSPSKKMTSVIADLFRQGYL